MKKLDLTKVTSALLGACGPGSKTTTSSGNTLRYDKDSIKSHIKKWLDQDPSEFAYEGIKTLKERAVSGVLRPGQIIFQEVSVSQHNDAEGLYGFFTDLLAPLLTLFKTGQMRNFAYFHTAVYVGECDGNHYVVENGGFEELGGFGAIALEKLEEAFCEDNGPSKYFVVSPPRDNGGFTMRYVVMQRALASIGVRYRYNMRAVNCETFATAMFGNDRVSLDPIQEGIIRAEKKDVDNNKKVRHVDYYKVFHSDLYRQINLVAPEVLGTLTVREYLDRPDKHITPWFHEFNLSKIRGKHQIRTGFYSHKSNDQTFYIKTRYRDLQAIGTGAFGLVFKAEDTLIGLPDDGENLRVAIKVFRRPFFTTVHASRVYRELRILKHMKHENILGLLDCFSPEPSLDFFDNIAMVTHLMGTDLSRIIRSKVLLTDEHIQFLVYQIFRGLKYLHSAGIIHGDLKPSNIGVNENCEIRILDLGLSYVGFAQQSKEMYRGGYIGTAFYRPPEFYLRKEITASFPMDIWPVGCIIAEMVNGEVLLPGKDSVERVQMILRLCGTPKTCPNPEDIGLLSFWESCGCWKRTDFRLKFPKASVPLLELLELIFVIDPDERVDATAALAHKYLAEYHDPDDEPTAAPYNIAFDNSDFSLKEWKEKVWEELIEYM